MFRLDDKFLKDLGLGALPTQAKQQSFAVLPGPRTADGHRRASGRNAANSSDAARVGAV